MKTIFSLDTETTNGKAFLLCVKNDKQNFVYTLKNKKNVLNFFAECLNKKFGTIGFAYNMDYDILALCKHFDKNFFTKLYLFKTVEYEGISFTYFPKKFFEVKKGNKKCTIYELYQYYNTSLNNAAQKFLNEKKIDIKTNYDIKNLQKYFKGKTKKDIINYCLHDTNLTLKLSNKLLNMINTIGLNTNKYYSCGYLAVKYANNRGINFKPIQDNEVNEFVKKSYFGGRIEFLQKGYFNNCYMYDINSAYPDKIKNLKTIYDYYFSPKIETFEGYFFVECEIDLPENLYNLIPYRTKTNLLIYPHGKFRCTIDNYTFTKVEKYVKKIYKVLNVLTINEYPFKSMVNDLYLKRLTTNNADENYIVKIILNSFYGKFAQQNYSYKVIKEMDAILNIDDNLTKMSGGGILKTPFGYFKKLKKFSPKSNVIYASLITAQTRLQMFETANKLNPSNVLGFMTDCIFTTQPLPKKEIDNKKKLGKFSLKEKSPIYIIGSGVYSTDKENKLRGYNTNENLLKLANENFSKNQLSINSSEKKGVGKIVVQGLDFNELNNIFDNQKFLNINFDTKRIWAKNFKNFGESLSTTVLSNAIKITE